MPASEVTYGEYVAGLRMLLLQNHRLSADANDFSGAADLYAEVVKLDDLCAHFVSADLRSRVGAMMTGKPANLSNARKAAENVLSALKAAIEAPGTAGNPSAQLSGALDKLATFLNSGGTGYAYVNKRSVLGNEPKQISDADFVFQLYQDLATLFQELRRPASKNDREATEVAGYMLAIERWAGVPADPAVAVNTWVDQHVSADQEPAKSLASAIGDPPDPQKTKVAVTQVQAALLTAGPIRAILERFAPPVWKPTTAPEVIRGYFGASMAAWLPLAAGFLVLVLGLFILAVPNDCPPAGGAGDHLNSDWTVKSSAGPNKGNLFMCAVPKWREELTAVFATKYNLTRPGATVSPSSREYAAGATTPQQASVGASASELKPRITWIISYAGQLLASFGAILTAFWIVVAAIDDQVTPVGYDAPRLRWLRLASMIFCMTAIVVGVVIAIVEYLLVDGLFRGQVRHVPVHAMLEAPENNLQWLIEIWLLPGIQRLTHPANYALGLAVIGLIAATSITLLQLPNMPQRRKAGNDLPYEQYLTRCFQRLTLAIYAGAILLAVSVTQVAARNAWPLSLLSGATDKTLTDAANQLSLLFGTLFTLFLAALYGPALIVLQRRSWQLVRATRPTDNNAEQTQWLAARNMSFTLSQKATHLIALLAPAITGLAVPSLLDLLKQ